LKLNKPPNPNHVRGRGAPKKMLKNNERIRAIKGHSHRLDVSKDSLYSLCHGCLG